MKEVSNETLLKLGVKYLPRFKYYTTEDGKIFKYSNKSGYKEVHPFYDKYKLYNVISMGGKKILWHRVILMNYIEQPEGKPHCNHINGNKLDNRLENLEWCDRSHNIREAQRLGLKPTKKLYQFTNEGKLIKVWDSINQARNIYGSGVCNAVRFNRVGVKYTTQLGYRWNTENKVPERKVYK